MPVNELAKQVAVTWAAVAGSDDDDECAKIVVVGEILQKLLKLILPLEPVAVLRCHQHPPPELARQRCRSGQRKHSATGPCKEDVLAAKRFPRAALKRVARPLRAVHPAPSTPPAFQAPSMSRSLCTNPATLKWSWCSK